MLMPELPTIPEYVYWIIAVALLVVGARFRLTALLQAGATPPGIRRRLRTARLLLLDALTFAATALLLRLQPFPLLISGILIVALTGGLLWVQWLFHPGVKNASGGSGGPADLLRSGVQGLQTAALSATYSRAQTWVHEEYRKNRWRLGAIYQFLMLALCFGLKVLNTAQGGLLYMLFAVLWQAGVTGWLYWQFDRRRPGSARPRPASGVVPPSTPASGSAARPVGPPQPSAVRKLPFSWPRSGSPRPAGAAPVPPGAVPPRTGAAARPTTPKRKTRFALRSDVQALVGLTAGIWCGIFSMLLGWAYGFFSVMTFRTLLSLGTPLASALLTRYLPQPLQAYVKPPQRPSRWTWAYLRSREFWYGPGMGLVGGLLGGVLRYLVWAR